MKHQEINEWKRGLEQIAQNENGYCKIPGYITGSGFQHWKK